MSNAVIHVEQVSKVYGSFRAVDSLSFDVKQGEIFAMLGPNGAGKSTTIRMILDILKPDSGSISLFGKPLDDAAKNRIGYLPEERGMYRNVKVIDMMVYLASLKGLAGGEARKRGMALLDRMGLAESAKKKVSELSKGMQQKVQFAITIIHDPDLVIVDEPFSGLDPVNTLMIKELLLEFPKRGKTVIMSTHQMYQVEEIAERLLMVNKGQKALYGTLDEVRRQYAHHAVNIKGQGDWARLPGVVRVDTQDRTGTVLSLAADATPNQLLSAIANDPSYQVERFELAIPSLNDIFIQIAGVSSEEAGEVYA